MPLERRIHVVRRFQDTIDYKYQWPDSGSGERSTTRNARILCKSHPTRGTVKRKRKQVSSLGGHLIFDRSVKDNRTVPAPPTFRHREWPEFRHAVQEKGAQRQRQRARRLVPAGRTSSQDQGQDSSARAPKEPQRPLLDFGAFLAHPPPPRPVSPSPRGQCQSVKTALETLMSPPPVTPADSQSRPRQAGSGTDFAS